MLMVLGMPLALLGADAASLRAGLHDGSRELRIERGLPAEDIARRSAHIAAVQTQSDAADQHAYVVLAEISVRTGGAALRAVEARVDAGEQRGALDRGPPRMCLKHLPSVGHGFSLRPVRDRLCRSVGAGSSPSRTGLLSLHLLKLLFHP
jgi:hypothetical protein